MRRRDNDTRPHDHTRRRIRSPRLQRDDARARALDHIGKTIGKRSEWLRECLTAHRNLQREGLAGAEHPVNQLPPASADRVVAAAAGQNANAAPARISYWM